MIWEEPVHFRKVTTHTTSQGQPPGSAAATEACCWAFSPLSDPKLFRVQKASYQGQTVRRNQVLPFCCLYMPRIGPSQGASEWSEVQKPKLQQKSSTSGQNKQGPCSVSRSRERRNSTECLGLWTHCRRDAVGTKATRHQGDLTVQTWRNLQPAFCRGQWKQRKTTRLGELRHTVMANTD